MREHKLGGMFQNRKAAILGSGVATGGRLVTAEEIDHLCGLQAGWTARNVGVLTRRFVAEGESAASMGAEAVRRALEAAGLGLADVDGVICASGIMQQPIPSTSALILNELGSDTAGLTSFDINSTCLSFLVAWDTASCLIHMGRFERLVIVSSEVASPGLNWREPESAGLIADGAAAVVVGRSSRATEDASVHASLLKTYAERAHLVEIRGGGSSLPATEHDGTNTSDFQFSMGGREVFRETMAHLPDFFDELFVNARFNWDDVDLMIPHQASPSSMRIVRRRLGIPRDKFFMTVERSGNAVAASIPLAMHEAIESGRMRRGMKVLLSGTSAGLSIGALLMTY